MSSSPPEPSVRGFSPDEKALPSCSSRIVTFLRTFFLQTYAMLTLTTTLMRRRWPIYVLHLLIPVVGLVYIRFIDILMVDFVKPGFDEVLQENPVGRPHLWNGRAFDLADLFEEIETSMMASFVVDDDFSDESRVTAVPNRLYMNWGKSTLSSYDILWWEDYLANQTDLSVMKVTDEKSGVIDDTILEQLDTEMNTHIGYNPILGAVRFRNATNDDAMLSYALEVETLLKRTGITVSFVTDILSMRNNHTTTSEFCIQVGLATHMYDCTVALEILLMDVVNSGLVRSLSGTITKTRVGHIPHRSEGFQYENNRGNVRSTLMMTSMVMALLPLFGYSLASDKERGLWKQMRLMGLSKGVYCLVRGSIFLWYYLVYAGAVLLFGKYAFAFRFFTQVDEGLLALFFVGNGLSLIGFSFFYSVFFNSGFGALFGGFGIVGIFPAFLMNILEQSIGKDASWVFKLLDFVYPLSVVDATLQLKRPSLYDFVSVGFDFIKNWEVTASLVILFVACPLYFALYWYLVEVLPQRHMKKTQGNESHHQWGEIETRDEDADVGREKEMIGEMTEEEMSEFGIVIHSLKKRYSGSSEFAVGGVSYRVKKSECFVLLGKNGAGKTTTIRMITGECSPTHGTAFVNGLSILTDLNRIQTRIGVCEQFDTLLDELTPLEHLLFFSRVRGVPLAEEQEQIVSIMKETGLLESLDSGDEVMCGGGGCISKKVGSLSAGMRRRLSIAISLLGSPDVLYLDEPTTGLDIQSRQEIWNVISRLKQTHSVLLTTHSMTEAEELSDRIAVMSKGRLVAIGQSLHLKKRFGKGYRLSVRYLPGHRVSVLGFIHRNISIDTGRHLIKDFGGNLLWEIPKSENLSISDLFCIIEKDKQEVGILNWSLNMTSLEDVFVHLVSSDEHDVTELVRENDALRLEVRRLEGEGRETEKSEAEEEKMKDDDVPLLLEKGSMDSPAVLPSGYLDEPGGPTAKMERIEKNCLLMQFWQLFILLKKSFILSYRRWFITITVFFSAFAVTLLVITWNSQNKPDKVAFYDPEPLDPFSNCRSSLPFPGYCYQLVYATNGNPLAEDVIRTMLLSESDLLVSHRGFSSSVEMRDWLVENPNRTLAAVDFDVATSVEGKPYLGWSILANTTGKFKPRGDAKMIAPQIELALYNALIFHQTGNANAIELTIQPFPMVPIKEMDRAHTVFPQIGAVFYGMCNAFVLIVSANVWVNDKESGLIGFMRAVGVKELPLFLSYAITFGVYSVASAVVGYLFSYFLGVPIFTGTNIVLGFCLLLLYCVNLLAMTTMFLPFLKSGRVAQVFTMAFIFLSFYTAFLFDGTVLYAVYERSKHYFVTYFLLPFLLPSLSFCKAYVDAGSKTLPVFDYQLRKFEPNVGYSWGDLFQPIQIPGLGFETPAPAIWWAWLLGSTVLYLVLAFLFTLIDEGWYLRSVFCRCCCLNSSSSDAAAETVLPVRGEAEEEDENGDVVDDEKSWISLDGVWKTYDGILKRLVCGCCAKKAPNWILRDLKLRVPPGSLTACLAPNATGKTTLMNLLTLSLPVTKGTARIMNRVVSEEPGIARESLGYVPQNSMIVDQLTAGETLELFAHLKGLKRRFVEKEICSVLKMVGLLDKRNELVGRFSGGMKRRMSVAISLIASPPVLLLDEPTTGVDPYSRMQIWQVLHEMKRSKSVLLATHDIEEAAFLADRVAILSKEIGSVAVHGKALSLQKRFGSGYRLSILLVEGEESQLALGRFTEVHGLSADQPLFGGKAGGGGSSFLLHSFNVAYSQLGRLIRAIRALENLQQQPGRFFQSWGVSQSSLEEIYLRTLREGPNLKENEAVELDFEGIEEEEKEEEEEEEVHGGAANDEELVEFVVEIDGQEFAFDSDGVGRNLDSGEEESGEVLYEYVLEDVEEED